MGRADQGSGGNRGLTGVRATSHIVDPGCVKTTLNDMILL
jgi:hypothetical protein